ncbi:MAG TPA: hypothetical protein VL361_05150 [Candidatus Limnocylindrales bacterium]|jgi:hypothetical protein|nr:hypothetical protein [Candidatus Limnocylindrales bacterium]
MNVRTVVTILTCTVCVGSVWAVLGQRQQLTALRREKERQISGTSSEPSTRESSPASGDSQAGGDASGAGGTSAELLRLRSEVTRLTARKRELEGVARENEQLQAQIQASSGNQLPAGYIRKAQAQFSGYSTPENTFQSFLTALKNHDSTMLLQSLTPGSAEKLQSHLQDANQTDAFFKHMDMIPGMALQNRQQLPDGSIQFDAEVAPGLPKQTMQLQLIGGQWKLDLPF